MNRTILLVLSIFAFTQSFLFSEEGAIRVILKEGSLILPDEIQISIGDSFESLKPFSPRYLKSRSGLKLHALTSSSSVIVYIDYDNEKITKINAYLYSVDEAWTEIEEAKVVGVDGIVEVSRGMKGKELIDILEKLGLPYILNYTKDIVVDLENYYKVEFGFLGDYKSKLEDRELEYIAHWRTPIIFVD